MFQGGSGEGGKKTKESKEKKAAGQDEGSAGLFSRISNKFVRKSEPEPAAAAGEARAKAKAKHAGEGGEKEKRAREERKRSSTGATTGGSDAPEKGKGKGKRPHPVSSRVTRDDSPEKRQRTIFVGNVPATMTKKSVKRLFVPFGAVESVRFRSQPLNLEKKLPYQDASLARRVAAVKGSEYVNAARTQKAFVVFKDAEDAKKAVALNMTEVEGKHILVDFAAANSKAEDGAAVQYDPALSVFLGNLATDVEEEEIIAFFHGQDHLPTLEGQVEAVRVVHDRATGLGKGIGYVLFKTKNAARAALQLNGEALKGRDLRVMKVKAQAAKPRAQSAGDNGAGGSKEEKRKRLGAFSRRKAAKGGEKDKSKPSWQGMQVKGKIGKEQNRTHRSKQKDKQLLSEMIKKHEMKKTTKNMLSRKKVAAKAHQRGPKGAKGAALRANPKAPRKSKK